MSNETKELERESIALRILWMVIFAIVWQLAEIVLGCVVLLQLGYRLFYGAPNAGLQGFGDSLSQYLQQIGRFGRRFTAFAIVAALVVFVFAIALRGYGWLDALMVVVALAVGVEIAIGAGIALQYLSPRVTLLLFATAVAIPAYFYDSLLLPARGMPGILRFLGRRGGGRGEKRRGDSIPIYAVTKWVIRYNGAIEVSNEHRRGDRCY